MSREVRRIPNNWEHPKGFNGEFIPLMNGPFSEHLKKWEEENKQWINGYRKDYINGGWKPLDGTEKAKTYSEWSGEKPIADEYMPEWPDKEKTMLVMYESTSEGTPISPAFETPRALARWLADTKASAFGDRTATYEEWLFLIGKGDI